MSQYEQIVLLQEEVYRRLAPDVELDRESISAVIDDILLEDVRFRGLSILQRYERKRAVLDRMQGLDVLSPLLEDDTITEIMVNGTENIYLEREGQLVKTELRFVTEEDLYRTIQRILASTNRVVNESSPIVDTRLADGSRVNVVLAPIALDGSAVTIRKFPKETMTIDRLIDFGAMPKDLARRLKDFVRERKNLFISGGTGSGKTSLLNALAQWIPKNERLVTIEDSAELQVRSVENLVRLEVRTANLAGNHSVSMRQLIRTALRMRPDRILVGEVRGEEAIEMLQAMNTGHCGSISTGHANSAWDMLARLETMVLMAINIPLLAIRQQIASALDVIIHLGRLPDGRRIVIEVQEVQGIQDGQIVLRRLYHHDKQAILPEEG